MYYIEGFESATDAQPRRPATLGGPIPTAQTRQLKPGGRMVIPVGAPSDVQHLLLVEKQSDGRTTTTRTLPVRFVPLTRDRGTKQ